MYKVFINPYFIQLSEENHIPDLAEISIREMESYGSDIMNVIQKNHYIHNQPDDTIQHLKKIYKHILAAGGVIFNQKNEILFIKRMGKWDLPKGKVEANEGMEEAAIREVMEECGLKNVNITKPLPDTFHLYFHKGKIVLKQVKWFEMQSNDTHLKAQIEEGITELKWFPIDQLKEPLSNTYENIKDFLQSHVIEKL